MPFSFPRIDLRINLSNFKNSLKETLGEIVQPMDLYEVFNTARDPNGQPYWKYVNDGTGPKMAGGFVTKKKGFFGKKIRTKEVNSKRRMVFFAGGIVRSHMVAGNPAFKMKENTLPSVRKYFVRRVNEGKLKKGEIVEYLPIVIGVKNKGMKEFLGASLLGTFLKSNIRKGGGLGVSDRYGAAFWISVMEDTMDFAIWKLAKETPVIKEEYYASGYTSEPGTLRDSYVWQRLTGPDGSATRVLGIEKYSAKQGRIPLYSSKYQQEGRRLSFRSVKAKHGISFGGIGSSRRKGLRATTSQAGIKRQPHILIGKPSGLRPGDPWYKDTHAKKEVHTDKYYTPKNKRKKD